MRNRVANLSALLIATLWLLPNQARAQEPVPVLMLGDQGFHKPSEFFRTLEGPLAKNSIRLEYTDNLSDINRENLAKYKGLLIFANVEQITPDAEAAMFGFVEDGGGLIPVHCASFCFLNSPKYVELVGGQFKRHGFTRFETKIVAPDHEIMRGLKPISSEDESYMHSRHNPDRIVLETRSDASGPVSDPNGEPYTWVRESGKGRVFYTAWGHDFRTWSNVGFQQLLARGILWACNEAVLTTSNTDSSTTAESKAVTEANRAFTVPEMVDPTIEESAFHFTDVAQRSQTTRRVRNGGHKPLP